jgi:hypothetical protein
LRPKEAEILGMAVAHAFLVDVVPEEQHGRRDTLLIQRPDGRIHMLHDGITVEFFGPRISHKEKNRLLIRRPLGGTLW